MMKLVAVMFLVAGTLCNSTLAMAEGPVPFSALMQTAGAQPVVPPITNATVASTQPAHKPPMTSGGKIMIGAGVGMVVIGGVVLLGTALLHDWGTPAKVGAGYATGGGLAAGGITLIVFGNHRRSAQ